MPTLGKEALLALFADLQKSSPRVNHLPRLPRETFLELVRFLGEDLWQTQAAWRQSTVYLESPVYAMCLVKANRQFFLATERTIQAWTREGDGEGAFSVQQTYERPVSKEDRGINAIVPCSENTFAILGESNSVSIFDLATASWRNLPEIVTTEHFVRSVTRLGRRTLLLGLGCSKVYYCHLDREMQPRLLLDCGENKGTPHLCAYGDDHFAMAWGGRFSLFKVSNMDQEEISVTLEEYDSHPRWHFACITKHGNLIAAGGSFCVIRNVKAGSWMSFRMFDHCGLCAQLVFLRTHLIAAPYHYKVDLFHTNGKLVASLPTEMISLRSAVLFDPWTLLVGGTGLIKNGRPIPPTQHSWDPDRPDRYQKRHMMEVWVVGDPLRSECPDITAPEAGPSDDDSPRAAKEAESKCALL